MRIFSIENEKRAHTHTHYDAFVFTLLLTFSRGKKIHTFPILLLMFPYRIFTRMHWRTHTHPSIRYTQFSVARVFRVFDVWVRNVCANLYSWLTDNRQIKNEKEESAAAGAASNSSSSSNRISIRKIFTQTTIEQQRTRNYFNIYLSFDFPHFSVCICT